MRGFIVGTIVTAIAFFVLTTVPAASYVNYDGELVGLLVLVADLRRGQRAHRADRPDARAAAHVHDDGPDRVRHQRRPAAADRAASPDATGFDLTVGDFPPTLLTLDTIVAAVVGARRPEPRQHGRPACRPRLSDAGSPTVPDAIATALRDVARRFGTPVYVTDLAALDAAAAAVRDAFPDPWIRQYSVKANDVPAIVAEVAARGFGANVVSRGEWAVARRAGVAERPDHPRGDRQDRRRPARGGPRDRGRRAPLRWVALESADEAEVAGRGWPGAPVWAGAAGRRSTSSSGSTRTSRRRRSPGSPSAPAASKFGMTETEATGVVEWLGDAARAARSGRAGSTSTSARSCGAVDAWRDAVRRGLAVVGLLRGTLDDVRHARRRWRLPGPAARTSRRPARSGSPASCPTSSTRVPEDRRPTRLAIEPGRALVARSGWLVARVLHVRERGGRQVVIDAGMTELIRPALYGARHPIVALTSLGPADRPATAGASTTSSRPASRGRSASRPTPSARTTCRRSVAATSWRSATPAPTPPRSPRPTTAGPRAAAGPPRARTASVRHRARRAGASTVTRYPACDATPRRPAAAPRRSALIAGRRRQRGVALAVAAAAGPPFPDPVDGQAVYDYAGVLRQTTVAPGRGRSSTRSRRRPRPRSSVYTQATRARRHHDRGGRGRRRRADGPVGRRAGRRQRRPGDPVRPRHQPPARPGPAVRRLRLRRARTSAPTSSRRSSTSDMLPLLAGRRPRLGAAGRAREGRAGGRRSTAPGTDPVGGQPAVARRRPARRSRSPRPTAPSTTTPASCRRTRSSRPRRRSTRSRRGPAPRSSSTPRTAATYPDDRGDRGEGARPDRPVGRRSRRASTTGWSSSSTWSRTSSTARSSCTPAPASRRPTSRTRSARRSSRTTCSRTSASADFDGALGVALDEGRRRRDARARGRAPARAPDQRGPRPRRRADRLPRACPAGRSSTGGGSARTRSTSTTRRS